MKLEELEEVVEKNILKLFSTFYEKPAIFLSEADVECYLYTLLINEPSIRDFSPTIQYVPGLCCMESSKSLLVHAELPVNIEDMEQKRERKPDISIFEPKETSDFSDWGLVVGIEIKYNRKEPARKEKSSILEDVKKVAAYKKGYILWLNWDREIKEDHLKKAEKSVEEYENVKLLYLDLFSDPVKTNVKGIPSTK